MDEGLRRELRMIGKRLGTTEGTRNAWEAVDGSGKSIGRVETFIIFFGIFQLLHGR